MTTITPQTLLRAYAAGIFPMAESAEDSALYWVEPEVRGVLPLDQLQCQSQPAQDDPPRRLRDPIDTEFGEVIDGCATKAFGRPNTWINGRIRSLYTQLHRLGCCHSVETWRHGRLVGGLYGVRLGGAFFGESMFSARARCQQGGAGSFGRAAQRRRILPARHPIHHAASARSGRSMPRQDYHRLLEAAIERKRTFRLAGDDDPEACWSCARSSSDE